MSRCQFCPTHPFDPLGHHALTCKYNGDAWCQATTDLGNRCLFESCRQAGVDGQMELVSGLGHDKLRTWPADALVPNWDLGKPVAFDLTVP